MLGIIYNISKHDLNLIRITFKLLYASNLSILKNKFLINLFLNLDLYNKSILIFSFIKNKYFFRNNIFDITNNFFKLYITFFKIIFFYNNSKFIDFSNLIKYKNFSIYKFYYFLKKIINLKFDKIINIFNFFFRYLINFINLIYYNFFFNIKYLIQFNFLKKNNLV